MPADKEWEWFEAYGLLEARADQVHGSDCKRAIGAVEASLQKLIPGSKREMDTASAGIRARGRIRLLEGTAKLALGQIDQAGEIIETLAVIEAVREGELPLSQLWLEYTVQWLSRLENCPLTLS